MRLIWEVLRYVILMYCKLNQVIKRHCVIHRMLIKTYFVEYRFIFFVVPHDLIFSALEAKENGKTGEIKTEVKVKQERESKISKASKSSTSNDAAADKKESSRWVVDFTVPLSEAVMFYIHPWENKWSPWAHGDHGSVMARLGHSSVTARSQLSQGEVTAQSRRSRLGHSSITAQVTAQSRLAVTILVTVSSSWAVTVANFFSHGLQNFYIVLIS